VCVCVCVHTRQRSCASLFLSFGKREIRLHRAQSITAVELLLLLLLMLVGSRRKKQKTKKVIGFAVSSCHYRYLVTVMSRQSSYLYKWDLEYVRAIRAP
jgi:hypothetical protein